MKPMKQHTVFKFFLILLSFTAALFIFHNSMYSLQQSTLQSDSVMHILNRFFAKYGYDIVLTQYTTRKLAHFTEYFIFGMILTITIKICSKSISKHLFLELFLFFAIPVLDETIQLAYLGRTSSLIDVWIDFAGCCVGMGLCLFIYLFIYLLIYLFSSNLKSPKHFK